MIWMALGCLAAGVLIWGGSWYVPVGWLVFTVGVAAWWRRGRRW